MILVKCTYFGWDQEVYVNLRRVEQMEDVGGYTRLQFVSGEVITVRELIDYFLQKINEQQYGFHIRE